MVGIAGQDVTEQPVPAAEVAERVSCFHCGTSCGGSALQTNNKAFCCHGCLTVHDLLTQSGLGHFYDLGQNPGIRLARSEPSASWSFLDEPETARRLVDFQDSKVTRVRFHIPAIHCIACVWLLENLFQLHPAVGRSRVHFPRREAAFSFETGKLRLSELVQLLASIGYEPRLTLSEMEKHPDPGSSNKRQWLQIGIAGFAFGNIMLFSLPLYLGLDSLSGPVFKTTFGWLSLAIALPVLAYSAADYWQAAWLAARRRTLTLDVPIAAGLAAIYGQSFYEITTATGAGYCDSLTGLIFFLLCGRLFQKATYDRMTFDRDYRCFFPLAVTRKDGNAEQTVALSSLQVGDRLLLRNGELIPADAILLSEKARLDYSFVTGESEPVHKSSGDYLYAGGQQIGSSIEIETVKPVSQSYLTSLWNHEAFQKHREHDLNTLTNRYSRRFTRIVLALAVAAALFWICFADSARAIKAFTSVLIVACPCALALAAPFALGTAQRLLARRQIFLKNPLVLETMAQADSLVFDKTGTLTQRANEISFASSGPNLTAAEKALAASLARHSTHPHARAINQFLVAEADSCPVRNFLEVEGCGIEGSVQSQLVRLGSRAWLEAEGISTPSGGAPQGSVVCLSIDRIYRGSFIISAGVRRAVPALLEKLGKHHQINLLSGDNERQRPLFQELFPSANLQFNQSPLDKLHFIRALQRSGKTVMMLGDGLNDAGALKQSDIGIAVVEKVGSFSPASDVILEAVQVSRLAEILALARSTTTIIRLSFALSAAYNLIGVSIAAAGLLSPLVCAVLMPLSSISVVLFACGATTWAARRAGLSPRTTISNPNLS